MTDFQNTGDAQPQTRTSPVNVSQPDKEATAASTTHVEPLKRNTTLYSSAFPAHATTRATEGNAGAFCFADGTLPAPQFV